MNIYRQYIKDQVRELLTNYGKIDIIWLDYYLCPGYRIISQGLKSKHN